MAKYTENFNLIKPEDDEYYDVADFNENMDIIDAELGAVADSANSAEIADKIGQPEDSILSTVFGKLNGFISPDGQGVRIVKSIQRKTAKIVSGIYGETFEYPIQPVDSSRCIVISERLTDTCSYISETSYRLYDDKLTVFFGTRQASCTVEIGFWIIEFY